MTKQTNPEENIDFKNLFLNMLNFISNQLGMTLEEMGNALPTTKLVVEYLQTLTPEETNREGRFLQALLNMSQDEMTSSQEGEKLKICAYAFALSSLLEDKTLASFILEKSGLESNKAVLSGLVHSLYFAHKDTDYFKSLLDLDSDLTSLNGFDSCLFLEMIENPNFSEEYLISQLAKVSNANVRNQLDFTAIPNPEEHNDQGLEYPVGLQPHDSLLMRAMRTERFELAKRLIEDKAADVNFSYPAWYGHTERVIDIALESGNSSLIKTIVAREGVVLTDSNTRSVTDIALESRDPSLIKTIIARKGVVLTDSDLFQLSSHSEAAEFWRLLGENETISLDLSKTNPNDSCLFYKLIVSNILTEDLLIDLLPYVKDVNVHNMSPYYSLSRGEAMSETPSMLMVSTHKGYFNLAKALITNGANVNYSCFDVSGPTKSIWDAFYFVQNQGAMEALIDRGDPIPVAGYQGLMEALIHTGNLIVVKNWGEYKLTIERDQLPTSCFAMGQELMEALIHTGKLIVPEEWERAQLTIKGFTLPISYFASRGTFLKNSDICLKWLHSDEICSWESLKKAIQYFSTPNNADAKHPQYVECFNNINSEMLSSISGYFSTFWAQCLTVCKSLFSPASGTIYLPPDTVELIGSFVFYNLLTEPEESSQVVEVTGEDATN